MKFTLNQIKKRAINGPFTFDNVVDVSELESMNNDIRNIEPVRVCGTCALQGSHIIFSFTISGKTILPCARTLVDVTYPLEVEADEVFTMSDNYSSDEEESEIYPVSGEVLDLTPYIMENILLDLPFRVFSDDKEALVQAIIQGKDWEFSTENEQSKKEKTIDPRLKKLQFLLDDKKDK